MYATCLFCTRPLGHNESIEEFPVGRRLAFDGAKGRLWVVCPQCGRWNLSPLEQRWEAIESCERAYRGTRLRASTENIGLARVGDGLELVRVGEPERPELAAWRYASTFAARYRKSMIQGAWGAGISIPVLWLGMPLLTAIPAGTLLLQAPSWYGIHRQRRRVMVRVQAEGEDVAVRGRHVKSARIIRASRDRDEPWTFAIETDAGPVRLQGEQARRAAGTLLAWYNQGGGRQKLIQQAVRRLEAVDTEDVADALFRRAAGDAATPEERFFARKHGGPTRLLRDLPRDEKLALEMVVHEHAERRALEGELAELERRWQEAEQIAAIADNLFLPQSVHAFLDRHRPRHELAESSLLAARPELD
jgi:hypothetical protein